MLLPLASHRPPRTRSTVGVLDRGGGDGGEGERGGGRGESRDGIAVLAAVPQAAGAAEEASRVGSAEQVPRRPREASGRRRRGATRVRQVYPGHSPLTTTALFLFPSSIIVIFWLCFGALTSV